MRHQHHHPAGRTGLLYSPGNWAVEGAAARALNPGAYVEMNFTGPACTLRFDTDALLGNPPQVFVAIDGQLEIVAVVAPTVEHRTEKCAAVFGQIRCDTTN